MKMERERMKVEAALRAVREETAALAALVARLRVVSERHDGAIADLETALRHLTGLAREGAGR